MIVAALAAAAIAAMSGCGSPGNPASPAATPASSARVRSSIAEGAELTNPVRWQAYVTGVPAGDVVSVRFLIDGKVRVTAKDKKVADLSGGDWFGEIALLTKVPRTATITAISDVRALVLTDRSFRRVVETMPSIALKVLASVGDRLAADQQNERS